MLDLVHTPQFLNVCFRVQGVSERELCRELDRQGLLKVGSACVCGQEVVRLCCVNGDFSEREVDFFFDTLLALRKDVIG